MKKRIISILLAVFVMALGFTACSKQETKEISFDGDAINEAINNYLVEEIGKQYTPTDVTIPTINIVKTEVSADGNIVVYGDFWVENYDIQGDTLFCQSGGHYPGVFYLQKDGKNYTVTNFDVPVDGSDFDESAKELFGDYYDDWQKVSSDDKARTALRTETISEYVKTHDISGITQYQDSGWDPVPLTTD